MARGASHPSAPVLAMAALALGLAAPPISVAAPPEDALPDAKPVPRFQAVPLPRHAISLRRDGEELARFHHAPDLDRPFLFPVRLPGMPSLTRMGHPHDPVSHSHHNSVWISHNDVDGLSFWADGDRPDRGRIVTRRIERLFDGDDGAGFTASIEWRSRADDRPVLTESRTVAMVPLPGADRDEDGALARGDGWLLVLDLALAPPEGSGKPAIVGQTPFGVIGVRMAKTIGVHDGGGRILNSEGAINEENVFRRPARWVDYSGPIIPDRTAGITLLDHPGNPGHPAPFHVRDDGWMGACLTLDEPLRIEPGGAPLRLRYGLWVHEGVPDRAAAEAVWEAFAARPIPETEEAAE